MSDAGWAVKVEMCLDYSAVSASEEFCGPSTVAGTTRDILDNAVLGRNGRILNGLEFPRWDAHVVRTPFSSQLVAWHHTRNHHNAPLNLPYPTGDMHWGLAGTADTVTFLHIDSDGLGTDIQVMCGMKVWGLLRAREDAPLRSMSFFTSTDFSLDTVSADAHYDFEAIVLKPGDRL